MTIEMSIDHNYDKMYPLITGMLVENDRKLISIGKMDFLFFNSEHMIVQIDYSQTQFSVVKLTTF
jgi:hypothetical protein